MRIAAALFCALVAQYWLGVATAGGAAPNFRLMTGVLAIGCVTAAIVSAVPPLRVRLGMPFRAIALALGLFAIAHSVLLNEWIRGDTDRYIWVIRQLQPCSSMGGGPGSLWMLATSAAFAVGALAYALSGGADRRTVKAGVAGAGSLAVATALAMFPDPPIYARILGCL